MVIDLKEEESIKLQKDLNNLYEIKIQYENNKENINNFRERKIPKTNL